MNAKRGIEEETIVIIELIGPSISPFVIKVKVAAQYKRFKFTHREYVGIRELQKLNPQTGKVPIVIIDGEPVIDSTVILRRFDQLEPVPALLAKDAKIAAQQRMLEDWSDESLYWYVQALRWCVRNEHLSLDQNRQFVPAPLRLFAKPLLRRLVGRQPLAQGLGRLPYDTLIDEARQRLDDLVLLLGDQPFFFADEPSVADFALYGVVSTALSGATPDFAEEFSTRGPLLDWQKRVRQMINR